jgi:mannitol-1-/sugar-/sorbitol-6-/2-deoxyglucose-6-phosphatase
MDMKIKAVIFDMDGVIVDSEPFWREAEMLIFPKYGIPMTEEMCLSMRGTKIDEVVRHWHSIYNWQPPRLDIIEREIVDKLMELVATKGKPMPGLIELFGWLRKNSIKIGLATSSLFEIMHHVLDTLQIRPYFDVVHSAEAEKAGKPAPDVYLGVASKMGLQPRECMAVEDSVTGIKSAKAAGMYTVAYPEALEYELEQYSLADVKIKNLSEISGFECFLNSVTIQNKNSKIF